MIPIKLWPSSTLTISRGRRRKKTVLRIGRLSRKDTEVWDGAIDGDGVEFSMKSTPKNRSMVQGWLESGVELKNVQIRMAEGTVYTFKSCVCVRFKIRAHTHAHWEHIEVSLKGPPADECNALW